MLTFGERRIQISAPWMSVRHEAERGAFHSTTGNCNPCCQALFMSLVVALVVWSGSFFFLLPLVTPNMHSFAPNRSTVGTLPQSASCNLRASAKSKCCWRKQHLLSIGSVEKSPKPACCFHFSHLQQHLFWHPRLFTLPVQ